MHESDTGASPQQVRSVTLLPQSRGPRPSPAADPSPFDSMCPICPGLPRLLQALPEAVLVLGAHGETLWFNSRWRDLVAEVLGPDADARDGPAPDGDGADLELYGPMWAALLQGDALEASWWTGGPHDTRRYFEATCIPMQRGGEVTSHVFLHREITPRVEAARRARRSRRTAEEITQAMPAGLYVYRLEPPDGLALVQGNPAAERLTGLDATAHRDRDFRELWPGEPARELHARLLEVVRTGRGIEVEEFEYRDGRLHGVYRVVGFPMSGGRLGVAFEDVTGRRRAEEERAEMEARLLHSQKLESLGLMAAGITHDFLNYLHPILSLSDLCLLELSAGRSVRTEIEEIHKAARMAASLTRQIQTYAGRAERRLRSVDLGEVIEEIHPLLRAAVPSRTMLELDLAADLPAVTADSNQLQQVLMNLVVNAAEASVDRYEPRVRLSTGTTWLSAEEPVSGSLPAPPRTGRYVWLQVEDWGCGLDEETRARLFDPFFTTKTTGRGLGMSVVMGIIRSHEGGVELDSRPGEGTRLRVYLPTHGPATPPG